MMQNSNYGESVKFYEKINQLHSQLKNYEEEQFTLEAEFGRLCTTEARLGNEDEDTEVVSGSKNADAAHVNNNNIPSTSFLSMEQVKFDDSSMEEKRRRRNDEILKKIKELEANASLFAARSERLRIMRSEYETLVRKYMAGRCNKNLGMTTKPNPSLTSAYSFLNNNSNNSHVSIGVNTNISIEPEPTIDTIPRPVDYNLNNASINNQGIDYDNNISATQNENQKSFFQIQQQKTPSAFSSVIPTAPTSQIPLSSGHLFNNNHHHQNGDLKTSGVIDKNVETIPNTIKPSTLMRQNQHNMIDFDRENEGRLRHNHYFDLSTTSESDLTSLGIKPKSNNNNNNNKPKMILPLNFNFDDTTQSDNTASLSITVPSKLAHNTKNSPSTNLNFRKIKVPQLPISLTTTASDISTIHTTQSHPPEKIVGAKGGEGGKRIPVGYYLDEAEVGRGIMENYNKVDDTQVDVDEDDLDISEGLTTSPGDSVMDSVQNRTLNESLPRENILETTATITKTMDQFLVTSVEKNTSADKDNGTEKATTKLTYYEMKTSSPEKNSITMAMSKTDEVTKTNFERNVTGAESRVVESSRISSINLGERRESLNQIKNSEEDPHKNIEKFETSTTVLRSSMEREIRTTIIDEKTQEGKGGDPWENNTFSIENKSKPINGSEVEKDVEDKSKELPVLTEPSKENKKLPPTQPTATTSSTSALAGSRRVRLKFDDYDSDSDSIQQAVIPRKIVGDPSGSKPELSQAGGNGKNKVDVTDDDEDSFFD